MMISMSQTALSSKVSDADAQRLIAAIVSDKWRSAVSDIRQRFNAAKAVGDDPKKAVAEYKLKLPAILWSGRFSTRASTGIIQHSGLLCLDLDHLSSEEIARLHDELRSDPHAYGCFVSPTGTGLKVVLRIPADAKRHYASFVAAERHMRNRYGVEVDQACKDVARLCFVSYDPGAWCHPNATELPVMDLESPRPAVAATTKIPPSASGGTEDEARILDAIRAIPSDDRDVWLKVGFALHAWDPGTRGFAIWDRWSGSSTKYDLDTQERTWAGMKEGRASEVTLGSLFALAKHNGWRDAKPRLNAPTASGPLEAEVSEPDLTMPPPVPWPGPMHPLAFSGLAGDLVRIIEPHTEADPAALLILLLSAFGNMAGNSVHFLAETRKHPMRIWPVLVGETAKGRKGSAGAAVKHILGLVDSDWVKGCMQSGLASGEGLIWAVRDPVTGSKRGRDGKMEEIVEDPGVSDKRLMVTEEEFSSVIKAGGREGNILSDVLRQCWDHGTLSTLTKNCPSRATDAHITVVGHITQIELRKLLSETDTANGFGNRILWVCVRRSKLLPEGGALHQENLAPVIGRIQAALRFARGQSLIETDQDAKAYWRDLYPALTGDRPGVLGAITNRAEAQVKRIALVYAMLDQSPVITVAHLQSALAVWDYCERSARYIFGNGMGDRIVDQVADALRMAGREGMTQTQVRDAFQRNLPLQRLSAALDILVKAGRVAKIKAEPSGRGRPACVWRWVDDENDQNDGNATANITPQYRSFLSFNALGSSSAAILADPIDSEPVVDVPGTSGA